MGIMVDSLLWVMQDLYHQPSSAVLMQGAFVVSVGFRSVLCDKYNKGRQAVLVIIQAPQ